eukprot:gnl/Hemi2/5539_TR1901_c0_g1_i1.p1 gnl/Hemi2/5539_TR1901_c0_g1~~gnl/Hemi2/5539_TR1901_c0_g1_i1.p1  ORF type:complete len:446 (-),score=156.34 gnl/Hemi2/5539_TR1901_c0_g1_i1:61-1323(-)
MAEEEKVRGLEAFVAEDFDQALKHFSRALEIAPGNTDYLLHRASTHMKLNNFLDALTDANSVLAANPNCAAAYKTKGMACFHLEEFASSKKAFHAGLRLEMAAGGNVAVYNTWIRKCNAELEEEAGGDSASSAAPSSSSASASASSSASGAPSQWTKIVTDSGVKYFNRQTNELVGSRPEHMEEDPRDDDDFKVASTPFFKNKSAAASSSSSSSSTAPTTTPTPAAVRQTTRYEWYQNDANVIITIFARDITAERASVDFKPNHLEVRLNLPSNTEFVLDIDLFAAIVAEQSRVTYLSTKVEISLRKTLAVWWKGLEASEAASAAPQPMMSQVSASTTAASASARTTKNWDKIAEEEDKKISGKEEQGIEQFFQQIYAGADEDAKRAMNKSYTESNGTVLSTNWKDVGKGKVKVPSEKKE